MKKKTDQVFESAKGVREPPNSLKPTLGIDGTLRAAKSANLFAQRPEIGNALTGITFPDLSPSTLGIGSTLSAVKSANLFAQ